MLIYCVVIDFTCDFVRFWLCVLSYIIGVCVCVCVCVPLMICIAACALLQGIILTINQILKICNDGKCV